MCVAVIGGLGYVGRHVVQQLLIMGYKVLIIDKNEDRLMISDLRKFDKSGKQLNFIKLSLPVINSRFKDLIISNNVNTVINVTGHQETPAKTLYLTKFIYSYLSSACKKVKSYIHTITMEDNVGYGYDKRLKIDVYPENWLGFHVCKDHTSTLKVGVLRLGEAYGHDNRISYHTPSQTWTQLESIRNGKLNKLPTYAEQVQTTDGTPLRDYCSIFDIAGGVIDMMGYIANAKGFDFAACDIGSGVNLSLKQFIEIYQHQYNTKIITDPSITLKPRPTLRGDAIGGGEMIGWTRLVSSTILHNDELNSSYQEFERQLLLQKVA